MTSRNSTIYWNLLDAPTDWLELAYLDSGGTSSATEMLNALVRAEPFFQFQAASGSTEAIRHLFFESKNHERLTGMAKLALGFPIAKVQENGEVQLRPLFFWKIELEASGPKPDRWLLKRSAPEARWINPAFAELFHHPEGAPPLESSAIQKAIEAINPQSEQILTEELFSASPLPPTEELWTESPDLTLVPGAVIGFFEPEPHLAAPTPPEPIDRSLDHDFGIPNLRPQAAEAYTRFREGSPVTVYSDFSSELHQFLSRILTNQLANGHTTLVVCDRAARLEEIRSRLSRYGLDNLCTIIRNPALDRHLLTQLVLNGLPETYILSTTHPYQLATARFQRSYRKLKAQFAAVRTPLLFDWNWTEVVGRFLHSQKIEGRELLDRQLKVSAFSWNEEEYQIIRSHLNESHELFDNVGTLKHPLTVVHPEVFRKNDREEARAICEAGLSSWKGRLEELQYALLENINSYALRLTELFEDHYLELRTSLDHLFELLEDFRTRFGKKVWERSNPGALAGMLSERKRKIRSRFEEILEACKLLEQAHASAQLSPLEFNWKKNRAMQIQEEAIHFQESLNQWRFRIPEFVEEEVQRYSSKQIHPNAPQSLSPAALEEQMDQMLSTINETTWLANPLQHRMMSLPKRQKYVEQITEMLDSVQINLRDFDSFYNWQHHWLQLGESSQLVVQALIKVKSDNWLAAFDSWYLHQILRRQPVENLPEQAELLQEHLEASDTLAQLLPAGIRDRWYQQFTTLLKKERSANSGLFKRMGQGKPENKPTLPEMFEEIGNTLASRFPVLCMTSHQAGQLLASGDLYFDSVVCWQTAQFPTDLRAHLEKLTSSTVFLSEQTGPHLENAISIDHPSTAFTGTWEELPISGMDWKVRPVMGSYDPDTRINDAEAKYIVQLLNEIGRNQQRTFPKVGIITLGPAQRNRIASYLLELKQTPNPGQEKVLQLDRNGMGVFTLEELGGQEFDLLLVSFELGLSSKENHEQLTSFVYPRLEQELRRLYRQPNLVLVHSLPAEVLESSQPSVWPLTRLIQFGKLLEEQNHTAARNLLESVVPGLGNQVPGTTFHQELTRIIEEETVWQTAELYERSSARIAPIQVTGTEEDGRYVQLYPDLFLSTEPYTSLYWEATQWKDDPAGNKTNTMVHSAAFWRNPEMAKKKFLDQLTENLMPSPQIILSEEEE